MSETRPLGAAAAVLTATAAFSAGGSLAGGRELDADTLAAAGTLASIAFASLAIAGGLIMRAPLCQSLGLVRTRPGAPSSAVLVAGQLGFGVTISLALAWSGWVEGSALEDLERAMGSARTARPESVALLTVGAALAPGIAEELLFRGLLLGIVLERFGAAPALVLSTLPFAALHFDPAHVAGAAALGAYLAAVRIATGSTVVCIICHVANNALAIALSARSWPDSMDALAIPMAVVAAVLAWRAIWHSWPAPVAREPAAD